MASPGAHVPLLRNEQDVLANLVSCGLVATQTVVDDGIEVTGASQRNRNFRVIGHAGPSYFVKQGTDPDRISSIAHEAAVYTALRDPPTFGGYLPQLRAYDPRACILVLDYARGSVNLREYYSRRRRFPVSLAARIGESLAALHDGRLLSAVRAKGNLSLPEQPPWALSIHRPALGLVREMSRANMQLIKLIQQFAALGGFLDDLRRDWRPEAIVHSDLKWDNCVVVPRPGTRRRPEIRIVDWELAALGDPCWDIGSVFHAYLSYWLLSIPMTGDQPPDALLPLARFPLERMQPSMCAFWIAYAGRGTLDRAARAQRLARSVRYASARLLQTAYEQMQVSTALTGNVICILQLALNMLQRPGEASVQLLGIPADGGMHLGGL